MLADSCLRTLYDVKGESWRAALCKGYTSNEMEISPAWPLSLQAPIRTVSRTAISSGSGLPV